MKKEERERLNIFWGVSCEGEREKEREEEIMNAGIING